VQVFGTEPPGQVPSRGTTTTAMMATVGINVATSHRLLTKIARPRCNAKNAR
jgi:hypothetical protein